jgi:putative ABC transport system permease protein
MFGSDQDDLIVVPIRMFQRRISGNQEIATIMLSSKNASGVENIKNGVTSLIRERRHVRAGDEDDFNVRDLREVVQTLSSTTKMLTLLLGAVAAISLLVGGIGIMNIMLVSVTERTREIGIRLAIGALENEVLLQFLVEAVVLSSLGGIIGMVLGISIGVGINLYFDLPFVFNSSIVIIAFFFSTLVGIVFGYFPARKAARLNPIDALRHE